jgi:hypothetical protein
MSADPVACSEFSTVARAGNEGLCVAESSGSWHGRRVVTKEAVAQGTSVESDSVSSMTSIATAFVDLAWITDAEVVADISPAIGVHVKVLDVSHLSVARGLSGAA